MPKVPSAAKEYSVVCDAQVNRVAIGTQEYSAVVSTHAFPNLVVFFALAFGKHRYLPMSSSLLYWCISVRAGVRCSYAAGLNSVLSFFDCLAIFRASGWP